MGRRIEDRAPDWYRAWTVGWAAARRRRNKAPGGIRTMATYVKDFGNFLADNGVAEPEQLSRDLMHRWQDGIRVRLSESSQQVAVSAVRSLLQWADREELSPRPGVWLWLDSVAVPEAMPRPLDEAALAAVTAYYVRRTRDLVRLRDRALFWFLITTGARISEALQVQTRQLSGAVVIRKKGRGEHVLVMSAQARQWIEDYLRARGRDQLACLWVHVGRGGRRYPLRPEQVNGVWADLAARLQLPRWTSHQLKHTGVTELGDDEGSNDDAIARHVGWKSTAMMRRYRSLRNKRRQLMVDQLDQLIPEPPPPPPRQPRPRRLRVVGEDQLGA